MTTCVAMTEADIRSIPDVPAYLWYYGCGPTAAGMIAGYWDAQGYPDLLRGTSNVWTTDPTDDPIRAMIASAGHIRDYWGVDRTPTPEDPLHESDCLADFMLCSLDPLPNGSSVYSRQGIGLRDYAACRGYEGADAPNVLYDDGLWDLFVAEIDAGRPVELYVDATDGDSSPDHYVTAFGYDDTPGARRYACYNTWNQAEHWYDFVRYSETTAWGVFGGTLFRPPVVDRWPGDANEDGATDISDLTILAGNYRTSDNIWRDGDFSGDSVVDISDLSILAGSYRTSAPAGQVAPEPAVLGLIGLGLGVVILRGRRRRTSPGGGRVLEKREAVPVERDIQALANSEPPRERR